MTKAEAYRNKLQEQYIALRPLSQKLYEDGCKCMPGGDTRTVTYFPPYPHYIQEARGAYLCDADGHKLLDFQNNYTSLIHGHAHPQTVTAVTEQIKKGSAYAAPFELQIKLAQLLTDRFPGIDLLRFTNSGTEANMHALRIARAYTGKAKIIKTEGGYHGTTDVFEASVDPNIKKAGTLDRIKVIPESRGVSTNALKDVLVTPFNDLERTQAMIEKHHDEVACFIIEPVMASAGQIPPTKEYLSLLRDLTKRHNIVLIFDEVVTGRLSLGGAQAYYGITPDLTTLGKIIGGGMPIGAFGGREDIMKMYDPREKLMYHSGTFNGNAISMAAGLATMEDFTQDKVDYINDLAAVWSTGVSRICGELGLHITISGVGSLRNLIFTNRPVRNYRDVAGSHENLNKLLFLSLITKGVFNAERGMFCISTVMTQADIQFSLDRLKESLFEMRDVIAEEAPELIV